MWRNIKSCTQSVESTCNITDASISRAEAASPKIFKKKGDGSPRHPISGVSSIPQVTANFSVCALLLRSDNSSTSLPRRLELFEHRCPLNRSLYLSLGQIPFSIIQPWHIDLRLVISLRFFKKDITVPVSTLDIVKSHQGEDTCVRQSAQVKSNLKGKRRATYHLHESC